MMDEEECGGSSCRRKLTAGCQRTLFMANYNSRGGPLIPAHEAVKYGILLSDYDLTSSNIVMQLNRMIWF